MPAAKAAKIGTVQDLLKGCPPVVRRWALSLRRMVRAVVPRTSERAYLGWCVLMFSRSRNFRMKDTFCAIGPMRAGVNFYFNKGVKLPDPDGLLEGTGKGMRHIKIRSSQDLRPAAAIKKLIRAAYRLKA